MFSGQSNVEHDGEHTGHEAPGSRASQKAVCQRLDRPL